MNMFILLPSRKAS